MLLGDKEKKQLAELFAQLKNPVRLVNFTQELECQFCHETRTLMEEVAAASDKIRVEVYNFQIDKDMVEAYKIDKIPATVIEGEKDYGIRLYGIPSGYEFTSLIDAIIGASKGESGLSEKTRGALRGLTSDVHLQVFVTPT
ncbi:MAG: thioredoxin family protein [Acidobacteriota bacterium]